MGQRRGDMDLKAWAQWGDRGHWSLTGCPGSPSSPRSPFAPSWPCREEARSEGSPHLAAVTPIGDPPTPAPALPRAQFPTAKPIGHTVSLYMEAHHLCPFPSLGKTHPRATFSRRARVTRKTNRALTHRENKGQAHSRLNPPRANRTPRGTHHTPISRGIAYLQHPRKRVSCTLFPPGALHAF